MVRIVRSSLAALAALTFHGLAPVSIGATPAQAAVVYCKAVGVPKGCVVRPTAAVVYCTAPGVPHGCVVRPVVVKPVVVAPVVVAPVPRAVHYNRYWNRGGPVNRVGRR